MRERLEQLEQSELDPESGDLLVVLCWLVREQIEVSEPELNAARRRAMFVLAAGGDPHRDLALDSIAASRLAAELDTEARRSRLADALEELGASAKGLPAVLSALEVLKVQPDLAWRSFALAILADEVADG
jgi:hypothetical protein